MTAIAPGGIAFVVASYFVLPIDCRKGDGLWWVQVLVALSLLASFLGLTGAAAELGCWGARVLPGSVLVAKILCKGLDLSPPPAAFGKGRTSI